MKLGSKRNFLVYCPTDGTPISADLFGPGRLFDVALNNYHGQNVGLEKAEHQFRARGHKWPGIHGNLSPLLDQYEAFAFLDNDIEATTEQLNQLFLIGQENNLQLWQASLTPDSFRSHFRFVSIPGNDLRPTPFVEIMMPFFSKEALRICHSTFVESQSGWGLDLVWPTLLKRGGLAVIDKIALRHSRPVQSEGWVMPNGLTPIQEADLLKQKYSFVLGQSASGSVTLQYGRRKLPNGH